MTIEEAIRWLNVERELIVEIPQDNSKELKEAYDMAIKALEQQHTCDSCKYYTHRNVCRESKNYCYCNRVTTTKMLPDDYCSRWEDSGGDSN